MILDRQLPANHIFARPSTAILSVAKLVLARRRGLLVRSRIDSSVHQVWEGDAAKVDSGGRINIFGAPMTEQIISRL